MNRILLFTFFLCIALAKSAYSQDLDVHWTQHYNAPSTINPALTGVFSGDYRFNAHYRNQWYTVPVRSETVSLAYDQKYYRPSMKKGLFGLGGHFFSDQAGDSRLRIMQLALNGSYQHLIAPKYYLSIGLQAAFNNRRYDPSGLTFDSQFNGNQFDPNIDPGEAFLNTNFSFFTAATGINLHNQQSERSWFDLGGGWFNFNQPAQRFNDDKSYKTDPRYTGYLHGSAKVGGPIDILYRGLAMFQGKNYESIAGLGLKWHLNEKKTRELGLRFGVDYRFNQNDAWAPVLGVDFRQWRATFSYDINSSDFREATNRNGGPELNIQYIITTVKPLPIVKSCPVY